jgi:protein-disulfide isomerase
MKTAPAVLAAVTAALLCAALPASAKISKDELKQALKDNPDVLLDVLKDNKKQLFEIVESAAQEEQQRRQQEQEEAAKKEFEDSFKNPKKPEITGKTRVRGNKDAKYTLVEYSDFQCPYCARGYSTVEALRKKYGGNLRFIYKNMPLPFHPQALPAAKWYEAVALQSPEKSWLFHDKMFQNQDKLGVDFFKETVKSLGLDVAKAEKDAGSQAVADKIEADSKEGKQMGFDGTPGFLLNGIPVKGAYPMDYFDSIIARLEGKGGATDK